MNISGLHRGAVLLLLLALLLGGTGSLLTTLTRPLPFSPPPAAGAAPIMAPVLVVRIHEALVGLVALLALTLALSASIGKIGKEASASLRAAAWGAVGVIGAAGWLGFSTRNGPLPPFAGVVQAQLAALLVSSAAAIAVLTSKNWRKPVVPAVNLPSSLRRVAIATPVLVLIQIALGAAFRHTVLDVVWHVLNALLVMLLIPVLGVSVLRRYPGHPTLRPAALTLLVITGVQVLLGIAVYTTLLIVEQSNIALTAARTAHAMTGSLTLAASVILTIQLRRSAGPESA